MSEMIWMYYQYLGLKEQVHKLSTCMEAWKYLALSTIEMTNARLKIIDCFLPPY